MVFKSPTKSPQKGSTAEEFEFIVPPEAPSYKPTPEEFSNPLSYIAKIRPEAEQYGICKIKPPADWQPPFAVDVDRFKFTPRIQRLNELEANTRIKLNFLDQIAKFWELQGSSLKIPMVDKRALDLYELHRIVEAEGGFQGVNQGKKWPKIANRLGVAQSKDIENVLQQYYERILYPFDVFKQGKILSEMKTEECDESTSTDEKPKKGEKDYKPHGIVSRQAIKPPEEKYARRSKRGFDKKKKDSVEKKLKPEAPRTPKKREKKSQVFEYDPLAKYVCFACGRGDSEEYMLLCDGCDDSHHTFCLVPPMAEIPKGDWRCPKCIAMEVSKPTEAFGFEQARREYTLQEFGEMADHFKATYFNMPAHMVPNSLVEREFWRIMNSIDEDVTVEYGADLHTMDHGSGFPTNPKSDENLAACDLEYAKSHWNLNNLPNLENSVLGYINADISGMKIPWMYVGMCFATFCWHNEDHWSYSINYMHWGEPKTWYGVPGGRAEAFEASMRSAAPELFQNQPDLLHQLVTIMNPNILMEAGVPVYRTDQEAGEFVITFPRAYHAGFNQGYNFAEAVNFATPDWLQMGRKCIDHYSMLRRFCVFSHDELVCKMASTAKSLDLDVAKAAYEDMRLMVDSETKIRKGLLEWGVTEAEREPFELLQDDERQCEVCKTTCFLSAVTCPCTPDQLVCLRHSTELCKCAPVKHILRYRYSLDELSTMLESLKLRASDYDNWCNKVDECLDEKKKKTLTLGEVKALLNQALENSYPNSDLLKNFKESVSLAEKCSGIAQQMVNKKLRTRTRQAHESKYKLTVEELTQFCEEIENLCCLLKEKDDIKDLLEKVKQFQNDSKKYLELVDLDSFDSAELEKFIDTGVTLDIDLPELVVLRQNLQRISWLEEVAELKEDESQVTSEALGRLLSDGIELPPHTLIEKEMAELQLLLMSVEKWETKAKDVLENKTRQPIETFEKVLEEANDIPAYLPSENAIRDAIKKAKDWINKAEPMNANADLTYMDAFDTMVNKGRSIPVHLELLSLFEEKVKNAKMWKDRTARTFLRKNSRYTLMEALSPRTEFGINVLKMKKKKGMDDSGSAAPVVFDVKMEGDVSAVSVVAAFKGAERQEMLSMKELRLDNLKKRANDTGDFKYCICRRGATGFMLQCELCKDWFHASCVPIPKTPTNKPRQSPAQQLAAAATREVKFLCPCCLRSRRPRLETILALLVSLQKLEVRVPEGEALQCLTERAMNWQDRARHSLGTEEVASALAKLSVYSQKQAEAAAREKTEKIISSELKKAAGKTGNPELERRVRQMSGVSPGEEASTSSGWLGTGEGNESRGHDAEMKQERSEEGVYTGNAEHAYSTASKTPVIKHPPVVLSELARAELEELMLEGDLLEVSLDETNLIWRILQATRQKPDKECYPPMEQLESELMASRAEKERIKAKQRANFLRKRRMEEMELQQQQQQQQQMIKGKKEGSTPPSHTPRKAAMKHVKEPELPPQRGTRKKLAGKRRSGSEGATPKKTPQKKRKPIEPSSSSSSDEEEGDDSDDCSAVKCLKPLGKEVDWVQCDGGCEKWFHFHCLGLTREDIGDQEDFICHNCNKFTGQMRSPVVRAQRRQLQMQKQMQRQQQQQMDRQRQEEQRRRHEEHRRRQEEHRRQNEIPLHHLQSHPMPPHRAKVEPSNLDESMGLDALLSLANAVPDSENNINMENQHGTWQQPNYNYEMEEPRAFHHNLPTIPTRSALNIATPLQNAQDIYPGTSNPGGNFPLPEGYHQPPFSIAEPILQYGGPHPEGAASYSYPPVPNYPSAPSFTYPNTYQEQFTEQYVLTQLGTEPKTASQSYQGNFEGFASGGDFVEGKNEEPRGGE